MADRDDSRLRRQHALSLDGRAHGRRAEVDADLLAEQRQPSVPDDAGQVADLGAWLIARCTPALGAEQPELDVHVLVASVQVIHVRELAGSLGAQCGDDQSSAAAYVRDRNRTT